MTSVLHLIPVLSGGGACRAAMATATTLSLEGQRHRIATLRESDPGVNARMGARGVEVLEAPSGDELRSALSEADIVLVHYWNSPELTELLERELPPVRLLVWSHVAGDEPPQVMPRGVVRGADLALATSGHGAGALAGATVVPPVPEWERLDGVSRSDRDGFNVGYVGLIGSMKIHPRFAEASAEIRVPGIRIIVCGGGDAFRGLRRRVAELGASERFELTGPVEDVRRHMADFDVFGYPLREAASSSSDLALKEAMYSGVPPVVLADGASDRIVEDGVTGVVAGGIEDYPRAVEALHADPDRRRALGEAAREHAGATWGREALAPVWAGVYEALMAEPKAARPALMEPAAEPRGARRLIRAMGGGPLEAALDGSEAEAIEADRLIAAGGPAVGFNDGGLVDHRRRYPDDPLLALWTGLFLRNAGRQALAEGELASAGRLGCPPSRLAAHAGATVPG